RIDGTAQGRDGRASQRPVFRARARGLHSWTTARLQTSRLEFIVWIRHGRQSVESTVVWAHGLFASRAYAAQPGGTAVISGAKLHRRDRVHAVSSARDAGGGSSAQSRTHAE